MAKKKTKPLKSISGYVFPDDYKPLLDPDNPGYAKIKARPGKLVEVQFLGPDGQPDPDSMPMHLHFINLFLEDLAKIEIKDIKDVRDFLAAITQASLLDIKGQFKGIYNAIQALRIFLTTEDVYQFTIQLHETISEFEQMKKYLKQDDINLARAEAKRGVVALELEEDNA